MRKILVNSLPKAGTNLVAKALLLFGFKEQSSIGAQMVLAKRPQSMLRRITAFSFHQGYLVGIDTPVEIARKAIDSMLESTPSGCFRNAHIGYTHDILHRANELGYAMILVIRDPRAVLASFVHFVLDRNTHVLHNDFVKMSNEERYLGALYGVFSDKAGLQPLNTRCRALDPWFESDQVCTVHFEDLVGPRGGGSTEAQNKVLHQIRDWTEAEKSPEDVVDKLFGAGRHTFRRGLIDSWKMKYLYICRVRSMRNLQIF